MASGNGGSPFQTTPSGVRGNIVNQTNSKNFAYGYFRLSEVDVKTILLNNITVLNRKDVQKTPLSSLN